MTTQETDFSFFDKTHMTEIIHQDMGTWFHAKLARFLYSILSSSEIKKFEPIYPNEIRYLRHYYKCGEIKDNRCNTCMELDKEGLYAFLDRKTKESHQET